MSVLTRLSGFFTPSPKPKGTEVARPMARFMGGNAGPLWAKWRPPLREPRDDVVESWRDAAARAVDLTQNLGWIAGAVDQAVANTVGTGLRLDARPDPKSLRLGPKRAKAWAKMVEQRWQVYANTPLECDAAGKIGFGQMQAQALRSYFMFGEVLAEHLWDRAPGGSYWSKVRIVPPTRLSQDNNPLERRLQGVKLNNIGRPLDYLFEYPDPWTGENKKQVIQAQDRYGRRIITHVFDGLPSQVRGITPLVPVLKVARRFDELSEATLLASIIQSLFAATMTSDMPTEDAIQGLLTTAELARASVDGKSPLEAWFDAQSGWYENTHFDTSIAGRIAHLFPGQELNFVTSRSPNDNYKDFALHLLREMARCLGITYESMTGDYAGVTFSSVRMATDEIYRIVLYRRLFILAPFCQAVYENWLEEEIDRGTIPLPGGIEQFLENRSAISNAVWLGSPKPQADDLKAAKAYQTYRDMGVISDAHIASELGRDIEDVYAELAEEMALRRKYGLPETLTSAQIRRDQDIKEKKVDQDAMADPDEEMPDG